MTVAWLDGSVMTAVGLAAASRPAAMASRNSAGGTMAPPVQARTHGLLDDGHAGKRSASFFLRRSSQT